jgi:hypothetical protein
VADLAESAASEHKQRDAARARSNMCVPTFDSRFDKWTHRRIFAALLVNTDAAHGHDCPDGSVAGGGSDSAGVDSEYGWVCRRG